MSMRIYGRNPGGKSGKYFRASTWEWPPIHHLMQTLCADLLSQDLLREMTHNLRGAGPADATTCQDMANRFESWLADHPEGHAVLPEHARIACHRTMRVLNAFHRSDIGVDLSDPHFCVDPDSLRAWTTFLRHCGGFRVE